MNNKEREYWIFKIPKPRPKIRKKLKEFFVTYSPIILCITIIILGIFIDTELILTELGRFIYAWGIIIGVLCSCAWWLCVKFIWRIGEKQEK